MCIRDSVWGAFTQHWDAINEGRSNKDLLHIVSHPRISQQEYLKMFVENQLTHAGVAKSDMPDLDVLVGEGRAEILGSNPEAWDPLDKDLQFTHQGKTCEVKSTITPSAHFLKDNLVNPHTPNTPNTCLLYTSPSPRDRQKSRMPSSA